MSNKLTEKELEQLLRLEMQLEKVRKAFHGKTVQIRGDTVVVSVPGSNVEIEYNLKDLLKAIKRKERGNVGHRKTVRAGRKNASTRKSTNGMSIAVEANNAKKAKIAIENRLRALRRAEREKKKATAAAGGAGAGGAGAGAARSPSSSKNSSAGSNNNMAGLVAGLGDMSVADVQSEIAVLEEALARMGL
jgi:hypothetical protein